jgi:hypothetical protein
MEMEDGEVRACLFSCALLVRAGACFVFGQWVLVGLGRRRDSC